MDLRPILQDPTKLLEDETKRAVLELLTLVEANAREAREKLCSGHVVLMQSEGVEVAPEATLARISNGQAKAPVVRTQKDQIRDVAVERLCSAAASAINVAQMGSNLGNLLAQAAG